ncbi:MAG: PAS domain-containing protein, partial [Bryobacteraceae bacterium]
GYHPPAAAVAAIGAVPKDGTIMMPTGHVSVEQLTAVLSTLPLDLPFVDADDRVTFFSEGPDRIFARSKAIIGRKVQHCHPPRSADTEYARHPIYFIPHCWTKPV